MRQKMKATLMAGLFAATSIAPDLVSTQANAQSFSCANAQIPSEMAICNYEPLLMKDEEVATLLASKIVTASAGGKLQAVSTEHQRWLEQRNACSNDIFCL
ncbi:MAG: hypothetical protein AAF352_08800, partial [Pseudomonadota bacterium]